MKSKNKIEKKNKLLIFLNLSLKNILIFPIILYNSHILLKLREEMLRDYYIPLSIYVNIMLIQPFDFQFYLEFVYNKNKYESSN